MFVAGRTNNYADPVQTGEEAKFILGRSQRLWASIAGTAVGSTGLAALFITENQAGTAVCLLLAGVLLLVGIQGTPLIRLGSGEHSFELDTARRTEEIAEKAQEVAEEDPQQADALLEGFLTANPAALSQPRMRQVQQLVYEQQVLNAISSEVPESVATVRGSFDMKVPSKHGGSIYVEALGGMGDIDNTMRVTRAAAVLNKIRNAMKSDELSKYLVITNSWQILYTGREMVDRGAVPPGTVKFVFWSPALGSAEILTALHDLDSTKIAQ